MDSLLLQQDVWDLCLDASGNIALASTPYAESQDVASAIKTFLGEVWFNKAIGVPYFQGILGKPLAAAFVKSKLVAAALTVPGVAAAVAYLDRLGPTRELVGQVQFTLASGQTGAVGFGAGSTFLLGGSILGGPDVLG